MCTSWPRICRICAFCCHEVQVSDDMCTSWSELTHYPAVKTYVSETPYSHIWSRSVTPSTRPTTNTKAPAPAPKPKAGCNLLRESDIIKSVTIDVSDMPPPARGCLPKGRRGSPESRSLIFISADYCGRLRLGH